MNDVYRAPREQPDLELVIAHIDQWHDKVLAGSRVPVQERSESLYPSSVSDLVSRIMARSLSNLGANIPTSQEFAQATQGLKDSVYNIAQFDSQAFELQTHIRNLVVSPGKIDKRETSSIIELLEINSGLQNSEVATNPNARVGIEDSAMHASTMFRELLIDNPDALEVIMNDKKVSDEVAYLVAKYEQLKQE
jgi:hypothetical protein